MIDGQPEQFLNSNAWIPVFQWLAKTDKYLVGIYISFACCIVPALMYIIVSSFWGMLIYEYSTEGGGLSHPSIHWSMNL